MAAEDNADYFYHLIFTGRESLLSFSRCERFFCPSMLFRRRFSRLLTLPPGRRYSSAMDRRVNSAPRAGIRHVAEKGNSYRYPRPRDLDPESARREAEEIAELSPAAARSSIVGILSLSWRPGN